MFGSFSVLTLFNFYLAPIVITSDRLRSSRFPEVDDSRPIRNKRHKYQGSDFIYADGRVDEKGMVSTDEKYTRDVKGAAKADVNPGEKLYPKRERIKTSKYEDFNKTSKQQLKSELNSDDLRGSNSSSSSSANTIQSAGVERRVEEYIIVHPSTADAFQLEGGGPSSVYSNVKDTEESSTGDENGYSSAMTAVDDDEAEREIQGANNELTNDKHTDVLCKKGNVSVAETEDFIGGQKQREDVEMEQDKGEPDEFELSADLLLRDIESAIDVVKVDGQVPSSSLLAGFDWTCSSSSEENEVVVTDEDVCLTRIRIPKHILNNDSRFVRAGQKRPTPAEIDDIPLSRLVGRNVLTGPLRIGKDGKLKRPVGRPRKNPVVINKVKRPVGRPRKEQSDMNEHQRKGHQNENVQVRTVYRISR